MIKYTVAILIFSLSVEIQAQKFLEGRVTSNYGQQNGIPYATLLSTENKKIGAVANLDGAFELVIPHEVENLRLYVSALGYKDSIINVNTNSTFLHVTLQEEPVVLKEININAKKLTDIRFGSPYYPILANADSNYITVRASQAGASVGCFFDTGRKKILLNSISILSSATHESPSEYKLEFYSTSKKPEYYRLINRDVLKPLISSPVSFKLGTSGWETIDVTSFNISSDERFLIVAVTKLNDIKTKNKQDGLFDYELTTQTDQPKKVSHFYIFGDRFAILKPTDGIPSIYIDGYTEID